MEIKILRSEKSKLCGEKYICELTDKLDSLVDGYRLFKLCRKSNEPIFRLEYKDKSIGDFMVYEGQFINRIYRIKNYSIYMSNITSIPELNSNRMINSINRLMKEYIDTEIYL